jgi:hypothetical protein
MKLVHLVGFIKREFVTMHGHMNVKYVTESVEFFGLNFEKDACFN